MKNDDEEELRRQLFIIPSMLQEEAFVRLKKRKIDQHLISGMMYKVRI